MSEFIKGQKIITTDTNEKGVIVNVYPPRRGGTLYRIFVGGREIDRTENKIRPDTDTSDPFERCKENMYDQYYDFVKVNTSFKIHNSNNSTISSLKASKTKFEVYQYIPLLKFINSPNHRLLIADEVGLGKTIEAGHIILELKARGELKNALVICPNSLREKWHEELYDKFGLDFTLYENIKEITRDLKGKNGTVRAIINYEKLRENVYKKEIEADLPTFLEEYHKEFSLIICDEAHRLRNRNTQQYRGANRIINLSKSVIFLTATPIMINVENLFNLLRLLDSKRFNNYEQFKNSLELNKPFLKAMYNLNNNWPFHKIASVLLNEEITTISIISSSSSPSPSIFSEDKTFEYKHIIKDYYKDSPIFKKIINLLKGEDTSATRAELQFEISNMSTMNNIFSRTRKRDVITDMSQTERMPQKEKISLKRKERKEFDKIINDYTEENRIISYSDEATIKPSSNFGLVQKKRRVASSVYGYLNSDYDLDRGIDKYAEYSDAKIERLLQIFEFAFKDKTKKIIVFSLFIKTIKYLSIRLKKNGINCLIIHGNIKNRNEIIERFRDDANIHVLLSSEVGSEGLDLQFCNSIVNYDLPWNPMVVEQRIGRIDRFGQQSPVVHIYNMVVSNSIQEEIYDKLLDRIGIFKSSIGDLEAILENDDDSGAESIQSMISNIENDFCKNELTTIQRDKKIREIAVAIERQRLELQKMEVQLSNDCLTNDLYFKNEIQRLVKKKSYVTEKELVNFVKMLIKDYLTACELKNIGDNIFEFSIPESNPKLLINFLNEFQPDNTEDTIIMFNNFRYQIEGKTKIRMTFNQDFAFEHKDYIYVNIYNPIIQATAYYYEKNLEKSRCTFCFEISRNKLMNVHKGKYFLGIYKIVESQNIFGKNQTKETLTPIVYDIKSMSIIKNKEIIDSFMSAIQEDGSSCYAEIDNDITQDLIDGMRMDFNTEISSIIDSINNDVKMRIDNDIMIRIKRTNEYYDSRLENFENQIEDRKRRNDLSPDEDNNNKSVIRLIESQVRILGKRRTEEINEISNTKPSMTTDDLLSLNLIIVK